MESALVLETEGSVVGGDQFRDQTRRREREGNEENCHHAARKSSRSTTLGSRANPLRKDGNCPEIEVFVSSWDTFASDGPVDSPSMQIAPLRVGLTRRLTAIEFYEGARV